MNEKNIFGFFNADGSIASWPEVDLNGRAVIRENATRAKVDSNRFVVVPVNVVVDDELKTALLGGYNGLQAWRNRTVLMPVVGFTQVDDNGNPIAPPVETFSSKRSKALTDDNS